MKQILGIGNALVDVLVQIQSDEILNELELPKGSMQLIDEKRLHKINQRIESEKKAFVSGGSCANTMAGLARLGNACSFIGKTGQDRTGEIFSEEIRKFGVNPVLLKSHTPSGTAMTFISPDSERTFGTFLGAAAELSPEDLKPEMFEGYELFYIEGYLVQNHTLIEQAAALAKAHEIKIAIDLASYNVVESNLEFLFHLIREYADIVFANEEESKALCGKNPQDALIYLSEICDIAIVKVGKEGSLIKNKEKVLHVNPLKANPVDTTGAGDLYAAGFLHGLLQDKPLTQCGEYGSLLAGNVIEVIGAKIDEERWVHIENKIKA
ncbi:MAG: adenosine kinase [Candidatus Azobacteroides sp.]|nr:adenosine kinase [Candidatus Azobacteroides sp.]